MKYLCIAKPRSTVSPIQIREERIPSETLRKMVVEGIDQMSQWLKSRKEAGKIEVGYGIVGGGAVAILDYDDPDEMNADLMQAANAAQMEFDAIPLCDFDKSTGALKAGLTRS